MNVFLAWSGYSVSDLYQEGCNHHITFWGIYDQMNIPAILLCDLQGKNCMQ